MKNCIFCKIANKKIPKEFGYEDSDVMVFDDINPLADVHILIVPKKHIEDFNDLVDNKLWVKIKKVAQIMIEKQGLTNKGYRLTVNGGGAQFIDHFHIHIIGPLGKAVEM